MSLPIMFDVFSSDRVRGSGGEVLGARALVDVLEERRLMSASVEQPLFAAGGASAPELGLEVDWKGLERGFEVGKGNVTPIDLSGANGPRTFGAARIEDGAGREDQHGTGAAVEWLEKVHVRTDAAPLTMNDPKAAGRFSNGRILKGNMRPVTTIRPGDARDYSRLFAA